VGVVAVKNLGSALGSGSAGAAGAGGGAAWLAGA
jgi:hypothetical protein